MDGPDLGRPDPDGATIPGWAVETIVNAGRRMDALGLVPATARNISVRLEDGRIALTRSGGHKGFLTAENVIAVHLDGTPASPGKPSAETGLHCQIYRLFPDAGAVLHGHSVAGTVLSMAANGPIRFTRELSAIGVRFERWTSPVELPDEAPSEQVLAAYKPYLDELMGSAGAGSADVIKLTPDNPNVEALRTKFISEHTHTEDEIRFFVQGSGNFIMHVGGRVYDAHCTAGDLISVPADTKHWFDAGPQPSFTALRVFTDTSGWVPHYTWDAVSERFPAS